MHLHRWNLALVGPPGSGKGSYGRVLSQALGLPLVSMSDLLQTTPSSGKLVDDSLVLETLLDGLQHHQNGYILEGFPRTLTQLQRMRDEWKGHKEPLQVQAILQLKVPDSICTTKMEGRRYCPNCDGHFNVNAVLDGPWDLPAQWPSEERSCDWKTVCQSTHWQTRPDDQPEIMARRLSLYHDHVDPIVELYEQEGRLLALSPHKGYAEVPQLVKQVQKWLLEIE